MDKADWEEANRRHSMEQLRATLWYQRLVLRTTMKHGFALLDALYPPHLVDNAPDQN